MNQKEEKKERKKIYSNFPKVFKQANSSTSQRLTRASALPVAKYLSPKKKFEI